MATVQRFTKEKVQDAVARVDDSQADFYAGLMTLALCNIERQREAMDGVLHPSDIADIVLATYEALGQ